MKKLLITVLGMGILVGCQAQEEIAKDESKADTEVNNKDDKKLPTQVNKEPIDPLKEEEDLTDQGVQDKTITNPAKVDNNMIKTTGNTENLSTSNPSNRDATISKVDAQKTTEEKQSTTKSKPKPPERLESFSYKNRTAGGATTDLNILNQRLNQLKKEKADDKAFIENRIPELENLIEKETIELEVFYQQSIQPNLEESQLTEIKKQMDDIQDRIDVYYNELQNLRRIPDEIYYLDSEIEFYEAYIAYLKENFSY
ncbi:hypothetical protein V7112_04055 [Bacillus sp. JJ1566]|uniref:hypothetical protein n=1 Tax=Bacillus sp. JJ1566 TaxID=3122961 RepID=UPI002FFDE861